MRLKKNLDCSVGFSRCFHQPFARSKNGDTCFLLRLWLEMGILAAARIPVHTSAKEPVGLFHAGQISTLMNNVTMPARFVIIDRNTPMLFSTDMNEWLPANHPARLLVTLIESLDLSAAKINLKGTGSCEYPPNMMLALITYCYSHGIFSSRKIEDATRDNVAVKYICAMTSPDHDTICKFRRNNGGLVKSVFVQTLELAGEMGIIQVGSLNVAFDGTKIKANTSSQPKTIKAIDEEIAKIAAHQEELNLEVGKLLEQAEATDAAEKNLVSPIPEELLDPDIQKEKLEAAKKLIAKKERRKANLEAAKATYAEAKAARAEERETQREAIKETEYGTVPKPLSPEVKDDDKVNIADPEATKMHNYRGYTEGYNAQAGRDVDGSGLFVGGRVSCEANDRNEMIKDIAVVEGNLGKDCMNTGIFDKGYDNTWQTTQVEESGDIVVLCDQQDRRKKPADEVSETDPGVEDGSTETPSPKPRSTRRRKKTKELRDGYYERLHDPEYIDIRRKRKHTIEPGFGDIKEGLGFRQFSLRGQEKVEIEFDWVLLASNINTLHRKEMWVSKYGEN